MALITCPNCGEQVSDRAESCLYCGSQLGSLKEPEARRCPECETPLEKGTGACPACGYPVEEEIPVKQEKPISESTSPAAATISLPVAKIKKIAITAAAIIGALALILIIKGSVSKKQYYSNLKKAVDVMLDGGAAAEDAAFLIHDVWYNCIFEKKDPETDKYTRPYGYFQDDFNDALQELFTDSTFKSKQSYIKKKQKEASELMAKLKNPPKEYTEEYNAVKDMHNAFLDLVECAISPSGNLTSYTSKVNDADSELVKYYKIAKAFFD